MSLLPSNMIQEYAKVRLLVVIAAMFHVVTKSLTSYASKYPLTYFIFLFSQLYLERFFDVRFVNAVSGKVRSFLLI